MNKQFLKADDLELKNGGYLINKNTNSPVSNSEFLKTQVRAHYVCTFAALAKGKNFTDRKADSLVDLKKEVETVLNSTKQRTFVETPALTERPITEALKNEALSFMNFQENSSKADKINKFLSEFETLAEFSEFGLYFDEDIVKLPVIYTMEDVVKAVTETIDLLG